jgi:multiple sugar transport system permease protein
MILQGSRSGRLAFVLLVLPALGLMVALMIWPLANGVAMSFTNASPLQPITTWIGLENYSDVLTDPLFWEVLGNTALLVGVSVALSLLAGFAVALVLSAGIRFLAFWRTAVFLVWIVPWIAVAILWGWMFNASYGVNNWILQRLGLIAEPLNFFADATLARVAIILGFSWRLVPFMMVISLVAIQSVPRELHEAAALDGASYWRRLFHIVLPMVRPILGIAAILQAVKLMQEVTLPWVLTQGGPANATTVLSLYTYKMAFDRWDFGTASAVGVIWLVFVALLALLFVRRRRGTA